MHGKYDKILQRKTEIELEEIFEPVYHEDGHELPLKVLIDGAPGVGKTTLSRKVSQKWAMGEFLQEYYLVLLLHLRERNIKEALKIDQFFYHDDAVVKNAAVTFVKATSGRGVLIIFDGFDELSLAERQCHKDSLYLKIVEGEILSECAVVVTSRPYASRPVQELQSVNRHIEVLGFTNEQIHKCIKQRINDEDKAEQLCAELKDRLDIASICQIPLNCSIVLYVYEVEDYRLPDTLTELYELFILHSLRRYTTRTQSANDVDIRDLCMLPNPIQDRFDILSKLAYSALQEDKLVFEREDLEKVFSLMLNTDLPVLDLMTSAKSYSSRGPHDTYSFLHLIIQEYLCAFWAAKNLSESEQLEFIRKNLKTERYYMVLQFFAGITKLNISDVCSILNSDLWEYDDHKHICHLLYESDCSSHSLCNYVAENCISNKDFTLRGYYSRFDLLVIFHFLAHSSYQWNSLRLKLSNVKLLHKAFSGLQSCSTAIRQVIILDRFSTDNSLTEFHEGTTSLLDEMSQFDNVQLDILIDCLQKSAFQTIRSSFKNVLIKTKAIKSICLFITGSNKHLATRYTCDGLIEGIAHGSSLLNDLTFKCLTMEDYKYLISLLIKWNSTLKLVTLSVPRGTTQFCHDEKQCHEFCDLLSTFLSKNVSLRQINMSLPFEVSRFMSCIDAIQSGLDKNSTLEDLTITSKKVIFKRNKHTSKLELVKGRKLLHSWSIESDDGIGSYQASPAKRPRLENLSEESHALSS